MNLATGPRPSREEWLGLRPEIRKPAMGRTIHQGYALRWMKGWALGPKGQQLTQRRATPWKTTTFQKPAIRAEGPAIRPAKGEAPPKSHDR